MTEPTKPTEPNDDEHDDDDDPKDKQDEDQAKPLRVKTRIQIRKFHGDDTSGEPFDVVEVKEDGFDELVAEIQRKEKQNAPD